MDISLYGKVKKKKTNNMGDKGTEGDERNNGTGENGN